MNGRRGRGGPRAILQQGEKSKNFKETMISLINYLKVYQFSIIMVLLFAIASAVFSIVGPKVLSLAITKLFEGAMAQIGGFGQIDFNYIARIIIILAILYLLSMIFGYFQGWIMSGVAMKVSYNLRKNISEKINRLPLRYFDTTNRGEILSRVTNDVDTLSQTLNQSLGQIITSITTMIGVLVMMLSISWRMTLVALATVPLSILIIRSIIMFSQRFFKLQQDYLGNVNGHVEEMYSGHTIIKAFNGEKESVKNFNIFNDLLYTVAWKSQFLTSILMPLMNFVGNLGYVATTVMGGYLAAQRIITVGDVQAFLQYVRHFSHPMTQIANISNILQQTAASAERVFEFLEEEEEPADSGLELDVNKISGQVEFKDIAFSYLPDNPVINGFSAMIKPGQKVAIVGPTGAGKTTIVKLLMRFYDLDQGTILIDGQDIKKFSRTSLRSIFGMVLQDTWLYNASILDNIRYGRVEASDEETIAAARAAHVDDFVHCLPGGYGMLLNEEATNISQGQKQLVTIARAILAKPRILIFDEATSSVDTRTEIFIQKAMNNLMHGRTSFIIAHRLSTIKDADLILVMDKGNIVEQGNHQELIVKNGFYAKLYYSQFEISSAS